MQKRRQMLYKLNNKSSLILEGGGLRGVFTCGVLDNFMERGINFPFTIGVSAGACNGLSYISNQKGRAKYSNIDLLQKYRYIGLKYLFTQRNIMDFNLLFHKFPDEIIPYDYNKLATTDKKFVMVTTSCETGEALYMEEYKDSRRVIDIVKASSSLPYVSPISYVDGIPMLDGGIADSIPIDYALSQGFDNPLIVLTRNRGYRKSESKSEFIPKLFYSKYPSLVKSIVSRNRRYNATLDYIEKMEDEGKFKVIRPYKPIEVGRMEKNANKLLSLYEEGYELASKFNLE